LSSFKAFLNKVRGRQPSEWNSTAKSKDICDNCVNLWEYVAQ